MDNCIFCKIIKKEIPSDIVYEDKHTIAFLDIAPQIKGHTLVVPKHHCRNLLDAPDDVAQTTILALKKVANAVKKAVNADGLNVEMNNESAAGQVVFHMHTHIIPRFEDDSISLLHNSKKTAISKEETQNIIKSIKQNL